MNIFRKHTLKSTSSLLAESLILLLFVLVIVEFGEDVKFERFFDTIKGNKIKGKKCNIEHLIIIHMHTYSKKVLVLYVKKKKTKSMKQNLCQTRKQATICHYYHRFIIIDLTNQIICFRQLLEIYV